MKQSKPLRFILLLTLLLPVYSQLFFISTSSSIMDQSSTYTIDSFDNVNVPANTIMVVAFPRQYNSSALNANSPYTISGSGCPFSATCAGMSVTYQGNSFSISGLFSSAFNGGLSFSISISNVPNPPFATSVGTFFFIFYQGSTLYHSFSSSLSGSFSSRIMTYTVQATLNTVSGLSPLKITLFPKSAITRIRFLLPDNWSNQTAVTSAFTLTDLSCSSQSNPSISCNLIGRFYDITNLNYTLGLPIDVTINHIFVPSSMANVGVVSTSAYVGSTVTDVCQVRILPSNFSPQSLRSITSSVTYPTANTISMTLSFLLPGSNLASDRISLAFPSTLIAPTASNYQIRVNNASVTTTVTVSSNTASFRPFNASGILKQLIQISVSNIVRPRECRPTGDFTISTQRTAFQFGKQSTSCCSFRVGNCNTLLVNSTQLSNSNRMAVGVTYTFTFTTNLQNLRTTDKIVINFPSQYNTIIRSSNQASICSSIVLTSLTNAPNIRSGIGCLVDTCHIQLSLFIFNNQVSSATFRVAIGGITNPGASPVVGFDISTISANGYVLEFVSGIAVTIIPTQLTTFSVTPGSFRVYQQTTYTFNMGINSPLLNGYNIQIVFPPQIININYSTMQCHINSIRLPCSRLIANTVIITINQTISSVTSLTISSIYNPASVQSTSSFVAKVFDAQGNQVESSSGSFTVTMSSTRTFSMLKASANRLRSNLVAIQQTMGYLNTVNSSLYITIVTPYTLQSLTSLTITISNTSLIRYGADTRCISSILPACVPSNSSNNVILTFPSTSFVSSTSLIQIQITNMTFNAWIGVSVLVDLRINGFASLSASTSIDSMFALSISDYSASMSSNILGQASTATLSMNLPTLITSQLTSITVLIPAQFGASSHSVSFPSSSLTNGTLSIPSLTNPITLSYSSFMFIIYNGQQTIAYSSPSDPTKTYSFSLLCTLPCRTCSSSTVCTSCYTSFTQIQQKYLDPVAGRCVVTCSQGQYLSSGSCLACSTNCSTCLMYGPGLTDGQGQVCLTCNSAFLLNSRCYSPCPIGYYISSSNCIACMSNCINCSSSQTCDSCQPGFVLYDKKCLYKCPVATYSVLNTTTLQNVCTSCPSQCALCDSIQCLYCNLGRFFDNGICVSSCGVNRFPSRSGICAFCECLTCQAYSYRCTSCSFGLFLYQNQCFSRCPDRYYASGNTCLVCMVNCSYCTTSTLCSLCQLPTALYTYNSTHSTCLSSCPSGAITTIDSSSLKFICRQCIAPCSTCIITTTYCTSCIGATYLYQGTCLASCPTNYFLFNGTCLICAPQCKVCTTGSPYICSSCAGGYYLSGTSCLSSCPNGTFPNVNNLRCTTCNPVCSICVNSTNCTSCISTHFLYQAFCYSSCSSISSSLYSYNGQCLPCQSMCSSCLSTPFQCTTCSHSSYYFNPVDRSCTINCTFPYYHNNSVCVLCQFPCLTCDVSVYSCLSCQGNLSAFGGKCYAQCPNGFFSSNGSCLSCASTCLTCTSTRCLLCQSYAYFYKNTCILDCTSTDLSITVDNYCTSCAQLPNCQSCSKSASATACFLCIYPYVIFDGKCLNTCPVNYVAKGLDNKCVISDSYKQQLNAIQKKNQPILPPFIFLIVYLCLIPILYLINNRFYPYVYHTGYWLALGAIIDTALLIYGAISIITLYEGNYLYQYKYLPLMVLAGGFGCRMVLACIFVVGVVICYYRKDVRYLQWSQIHSTGFIGNIIGSLILGPRWHKLYYSKAFGLPLFAFRIVSVSKFYAEDLINWIHIITDLCQWSAFVIVAYNIFIKYALLYLLPFEIIAIKVILWGLFLYDLKKPDRGFFFGDQQQAARMIAEEEKANDQKRRHMELDSIVKLIRQHSAPLLTHQKLYDPLFIQDFRSVFDPNDYQQMPVVPKKKIGKYIQRGKFRKGKRISIQQKLRRFADSIKPPVIKQKSYLNDWLYWKPPKKMQTLLVQPARQSQQSMLKLLQQKQMLYGGLQGLQILDIDEQSNIQKDSRVRRRRKVSYAQQTIYDPSSIEYLQADEEDFNNLLNRNYAGKQHLPSNNTMRYDDTELRILKHQPLKRRFRARQTGTKYY